MHLTAIVLAAGASQRMGADNKLLLPLDGRPLVAHVVAAVGAAIEDVVVVTGHDREAVEAALADRPVRFAHNAAHAQGMASSLVCGVEAAAPGTNGLLVCPGDLPLVRPSTMRALRLAFAEAGHPVIAVPVCQERRGHPVLFDAAFRNELLQLTGDGGARPVLDAFPQAVVEVAVRDRGIFYDVDTREAYDGLPG